MTEAGLSHGREEARQAGDKTAIKKYLGDQYAAASKVNIVD